MKTIKIILPVTLCILTLFTIQASAQEQTEVSNTEETQVDSMQAVHERDKAKTQREVDSDRMTEVRNERGETKAKAKEAQRVENDANDAAKESKDALRAEKKAQKLRRKADKQAETAEDAREKSDRN
jgi:hypothetical protein